MEFQIRTLMEPMWLVTRKFSNNYWIFIRNIQTIIQFSPEWIQDRWRLSENIRIKSNYRMLLRGDMRHNLL